MLSLTTRRCLVHRPFRFENRDFLKLPLQMKLERVKASSKYSWDWWYKGTVALFKNDARWERNRRKVRSSWFSVLV